MNPLIIKLGGVLLDSEEALERLFAALVSRTSVRWSLCTVAAVWLTS